MSDLPFLDLLGNVALDKEKEKLRLGPERRGGRWKVEVRS
jgi:hypothetical protein